jgi:hypothetical protein
MNPVEVVLGTTILLLAAWYWRHCAVPALHAHGVTGSLAALAAASTASVVVAAICVMFAIGPVSLREAALLATGFAWFLLCGLLMWPRYSPLVRPSSFPKN